MSDRELLELAAKAAGIDATFIDGNGVVLDAGKTNTDPVIWWNPLTNDGDALRLAVKLKLLIDTDHCCAMPIDKSGENPDDWSDGQLDDDHYAATRRAIVRAAAEIGKHSAPSDSGRNDG